MPTVTDASPSRASVPARCGACSRIFQIGDYPFTCNGTGDHSYHGGTLNAAIHTSERAVIYRNPRTGVVRYPARTDLPMHPTFAAQGFVREEIATHQERRALERQTGRIQESAYYDSPSTAETALTSQIGPPPDTSPLDRHRN